MTELSTLRDLSVKATRVTDDGLLQHISQLSESQGLLLAYLNISDASLLALESVVWLERVNLRHTSITNDGIVNFVSGKTHTLRRLNLSNTVISDAALAECLPHSQLASLSLIDTSITDAASKACAGSEWLADLRLNLTDITDDGARHLANCVHLKNLELFRTKVTDTGLVWLSDTVSNILVSAIHP